MASLVNNLGGPAGFGENALPTSQTYPDYIDITSVFPNGLNYFGKIFKGIEIDQFGWVDLIKSAEEYYDVPASIFALHTFSHSSATPGAASPGGTSTGSNKVYWDLDPVHHRVTITWDDVMPGDPAVKTGDAFQLILADKSAVTGTPGDFDIVLRYEAVSWLNPGGYGSYANIQSDYSSHAISIVTQGDTTSLLNLPNSSNIGVPGVFNYLIRNANPTGLSVAADPIKYHSYIEDTDGSFTGYGPGILEGTKSDTPLQFTVTRDGPLDAPLDVAWQISSRDHYGNQQANPVDAADLVGGAFSGIVHFAAGAATADLKLLIAGDSIVEPSEYLRIVFSNDAIVATAETALYVLNDEVVNFVGTSGHDTSYGSAANDMLSGGGGNDYLNGEIGDDLIMGGPGNDDLIGGDGIDTVSYADSTAGVVVTLALQRFSYGQDTKGAGGDYLSGFENLTGSIHNDSLIGDAGVNVIAGLAGDDRLDSRAGADTLVGGTGNDTYVIWSGAETVVEQFGEGTDRVLARISATLGDNVERLNLIGTAAIDGTGNADANVIIGNAAANVLNGAGGADRLTGRGGADTFEFAPSGAAAKPVVITDFAHGTDRLLIEADALSALHGLAGQMLTDADLALGPKATTHDQHLIYYAKTGALYYDADGAGGQAQIKIAVLLGPPDLHAGDIGVIAI